MDRNRILNFLIAFAAGFISVPIFHQGMLIVLNQIDFIQATPFPTRSTQPFGIPAIWSMSFWGGVWGIILAVIILNLRQKKSYWLTALLFGAFAPTAVFLFIVSPLKGMPFAADWELKRIATGLLVNGAWGLGTALILYFAVDRVTKFRSQ